MKRTSATIKSIIDGITMYSAWYFYMAFLFWLAFHLLDIGIVQFWQCMGGVILLRQSIAMIRMPHDRHLKEDKKEIETIKNLKEDE